MHTEVKIIAEAEHDDMSVQDGNSESGQDAEQPTFNIDQFEQPRLRLKAFIERLAESADVPVNLEKYRAEMPVKKSQLVYGTATVLSIADSMIKKARATRKLKRNWSKYDLIVMFWVIEKYTALTGRKPADYGEEDWQTIASLIPGKHRFACMFKWLNLKMNIKATREPWSESETSLLLKVVTERKALSLDQLKSHWSVVSHRIYLESKAPRIYRTAKQCRERWGCTNPDVKKDLWSRGEDIHLLKGYLELGKKWAIISRQLVARTQNAVKNRFQLLEKKIANKAKKEGQQSLRSYIHRYIQQLEIEQCLKGPERIKVETGGDSILGEYPIEVPQVRQPVPPAPPKRTAEEPQISSIIMPFPRLQQILTKEQTMNIRQSRMTGDLLTSSLRKALVPMVFDKQRMIMQPAPIMSSFTLTKMRCQAPPTQNNPIENQ